jgi:CheY-like chemotaxis protein
MLRIEALRSPKANALPTLIGRHILVVEDDYVLAMDMRLTLEDVGAEVVGPVGTLRDALRLVENEDFDAAVLDIDLHGELIFAVAERLQARAIPFIFTTGYEATMLPERFAATTRYRKPINAEAVVDALAYEFTR